MLIKKNIFIGTFVDLPGVVVELGLGREKADGGVSEHRIDLIDDTRHLFTRFRIDGRKAMSRGISGGKQKIKFANTRNRGRLCLFS